MIVVIDTNVWISALQFAKRRGTPTLALETAMGEDVIATCDQIDAEMVRDARPLADSPLQIAAR